MKIALINENSQAAKNSMIESVLKEVVTFIYNKYIIIFYYNVLRGQRELFMEKVPQNQPHAPFPNNL